MLKPSAYNFIFTYDQSDKVLMFNSLSGAVLILGTTYYENEVRPVLESLTGKEATPDGQEASCV
jgi:hypothetical protein